MHKFYLVIPDRYIFPIKNGESSLLNRAQSDCTYVVCRDVMHEVNILPCVTLTATINISQERLVNGIFIVVFHLALLQL